MKKVFFTAVIPCLLSVVASAHGTKASMTSASIGVATEMFEKDHAADLANYTGVKGWPDGQNIQVKIYLTNNRVISYLCMMMRENLMCHPQ